MKSININNKQSGFSLIEMLVVITLIGLLASVVLSSVRDTRLSAQYAAAEVEMKKFADAVRTTGDMNTALKDVTGRNCTGCSCRPDTSDTDVDPVLTSLHDVPDSHLCVSRWIDTLDKVAEASPLLDDYSNLIRDPWGFPYVLDENELEREEGDGQGPCGSDHIRTVGPDGLFRTSDDCWYPLPFKTSTCKDEVQNNWPACNTVDLREEEEEELSF